MSTDRWIDPWAGVASVVTWTSVQARHVLHGPTMGTRYSAVFTAPADVDLRVLGAALQSTVDCVDRQMSNWQPTSDVSRFNAAATGIWVPVDPDLLEVVETGLEIGRRSGGAFDIGLGRMVNAWGFGPAHSGPNAVAIAALTPAGATRDLLELDRRNGLIRKHAPLHLDLCGIAKGFGVDQLARGLDAHGVGNYLVSIDGELRARGCRPDGKPWVVAIERPNYIDRTIAATITLRDQAIATSGDYRHRHLHRGRTVSHTIDPRTAHPVDNGLASVSVLAANAMVADAWATALLVAGETAGPEIAAAQGLDALFIIRRGDALFELRIGKFA